MEEGGANVSPDMQTDLAKEPLAPDCAAHSKGSDGKAAVDVGAPAHADPEKYEIDAAAPAFAQLRE